ncbi:hypothetical protein CQ020_17225 [Arthrobacter sp. MYb23]|uniref:PIN domain-containing protein n=1 Tax=unclassified Arthrobacter TaxID=235627 RepID=UPI000CFD971C|nr:MULTISPECIES: PIN domain-containing protein [unclassified Arthrobacter]PRB43510.1 hypothetical protein CQ038_07740 [Arthrobacter sp. MYb51]PRB93754.1 hypothetical protein CQ020_17225 [Arthrobacter sp. MYb23]
MLVIIPDTNILAASPSLASPAWQSLIQHREEWQLQIVVPDVVLMETVNVVRRSWTAEQEKLKGLKVGEFGLGDAAEALHDGIQQHIDAYEGELQRKLADIGTRVFPMPPVDHLEVARRASNRTPPYQGESKDGYRDTLIWLTVMAVADEYSSEHIWFVSDNTKDFGPKGNDWTGPNIGARTDCPILFHPGLNQELASRGVAKRVNFVTNLQLLEQHIAALHGPISPEELARLTSELDFASLNGILEMMPKGSKVVPSEAALNPSITQAFLHHLTVNEAPWNFTDAARRGEGRWTASYTADAKVELTTFTGEGTPGVVTKDLRLSGFVNIKQPNEVEKLEITTMGSLPDDPDRVLWEMDHDSLRGVAGFSGTFNLPPGFLDNVHFQPPSGFMEGLKFEPPAGFMEGLKFEPPAGFMEGLKFEPPAGFMEGLKFEPPAGFMEGLKFEPPAGFMEGLKFRLPPGFKTGNSPRKPSSDHGKVAQPDGMEEAANDKDETGGPAGPTAGEENPES